MSITENGRKALLEIADWLEAGTPHVDRDGRQVDFFSMEYPVSKEPACGTTCCIAGAVVQFNALGDLENGQLSWLPTKRLASGFLGMDNKEATDLFEPWCSFQGDDDSFNNPIRAAKVVRHYLETGIVDWDKFPDENEE